MFVGSLQLQTCSKNDPSEVTPTAAPKVAPPVPPRENFITDEAVSDTLKDLDSEFGDLAVRMAGEVWGRAGLSQKERAFLCIAANVCNQTLDAPYELHIELAMKGGATPEQIREVLLHMAIYASFPKALQAIKVMHAHFEKKGIALGRH